MNNNLIRVYDPRGGGSIGVYQNIGNISTYGNEAEFILMLNSKINFFANYSQFVSTFGWNPENTRKADLTFFSNQTQCGRQMKNIPQVRSNAGFSFMFYKFSLFAGLNYGSASQNNKRFYLEENRFVRIPAWLQSNFNICYMVNNKFKIRLAANNIGKKYSDPDESTSIDNFGQKGLAQPSQTFLLELNYKY